MAQNTRKTRHFLYKHPLFTKAKSGSGVKYQNCVYYLWFEYLLLNEEYKQYCETKKGTKAVAKLYEDFGDIHNTTFQKWWRTTGQELFCERLDLERVEEITKNTQSNSEYVLNLAIPLNKQVAWIEKQISKKVKDRRKELGVVGRGAGISTAKYPIHTTNPDIKALQKGLEIWRESQRGLSAVQVANKLRKYFPAKDLPFENDRSNRQMVWRLKKATQQIIDNTAKVQLNRRGERALGVFPKHKARG